MYRKLLSVIPFTIIILIISDSCVTTLQSYKPKDVEEMEIKELLLKMENTWNNHDVHGYLALWNDKAYFMYGSDRQIVSKNELAQILPEMMMANPKIKYGTPDISVSDNEAEVSMEVLIENTKISVTNYLIKKNGLWSVIGHKY